MANRGRRSPSPGPAATPVAPRLRRRLEVTLERLDDVREWLLAELDAIGAR
jgi:hypothetical protein